MLDLARIRTFRALRYREFRLLWLGQAGNSLGQWMDQVTRGWLMYELTDSPVQLGLVSAVRAVPLLLLSVVAGAAADRYGRKTQLVVSQATNACLNVVLAVLVLTRHVQPWHLYATGLMAGAVMAFQQPARQAMISDVVSEADLANAVGLNSMIFNASRSIGPAAAGLLIAAMGAGGSYLVQGLIYAMSTVWTLQMRVADGGPELARRPGHGRPSLLASTVEGWRYIAANRPVLMVMLVVLIPSVLGQPYTSLMPVFARDVLHVGSVGQGLLLTSVGLGALVGAVLVATFDTRRQGLFMLTGAVIFGVSLFLFGAIPSLAVALPLMAVSGLANVSYGAQANTLLQRQTPPQLRGRVMGTYFLSRGLTPLGSLVAGTIAAVIGAPLTVMGMGASCALIAVAVLCLAPSLRRMG